MATHEFTTRVNKLGVPGNLSPSWTVKRMTGAGSEASRPASGHAKTVGQLACAEPLGVALPCAGDAPSAGPAKQGPREAARRMTKRSMSEACEDKHAPASTAAASELSESLVQASLLDTRWLVLYEPLGENPVCSVILAALTHVQGVRGRRLWIPLLRGCFHFERSVPHRAFG